MAVTFDLIGDDMKLGKLLKTVVKIGEEQALPIADAFGVPGAGTVSAAVGLIHGNKEQNDNEAVKMLAATVDALDQRLQVAERVIKELKKSGLRD